MAAVRRRRETKTTVAAASAPAQQEEEEHDTMPTDTTIGAATDLQTRELVRAKLMDQVARLDPTRWPFALAPTHQRWKEFLMLYLDPKNAPPAKLSVVNVPDKSLTVIVNGIILPLNLLSAAVLIHLTFTTKLVKNERRLAHGLENYIGGMTKRAFAPSGQI